MGLNDRSMLDTIQQTIMVASLSSALPTAVSVFAINATAGAPGEATMLVGILNSEPLTLEVRC